MKHKHNKNTVRQVMFLLWLTHPHVQSSRRSEAWWSWKGWNCAWASSHRWCDTWASPSPSKSGMGFPPRSAYLWVQESEVSQDGDLWVVLDLGSKLWGTCYSSWSQMDVKFALPRKVVEMYSDTWFPERLISDKWDSSLFNILLNWGEDRQKQKVSRLLTYPKM